MFEKIIQKKVSVKEIKEQMKKVNEQQLILEAMLLKAKNEGLFKNCILVDEAIIHRGAEHLRASVADTKLYEMLLREFPRDA